MKRSEPESTCPRCGGPLEIREMLCPECFEAVWSTFTATPEDQGKD